MKALKLVVIGIGMAVGIFLFGASISAQRVGLPVDERIASLEKKVSALETENQQLKKDNQQLQKDVFSAKLILVSMEKSLSNLKDDYANHYHKIQASTAPPSAVDIEEKQGKKPYLLYSSMEQLKNNKGVLTSAPVAKQ
jgi:septal ring factor EnvC (AmiA/AmiB activator)